MIYKGKYFPCFIHYLDYIIDSSCDRNWLVVSLLSFLLVKDGYKNHRISGVVDHRNMRDWLDFQVGLTGHFDIESQRVSDCKKSIPKFGGSKPDLQVRSHQTIEDVEMGF